MNDNENKYIAAFLLHALGDTIGFKNADWEFNYNRESTLDTINEFIFEFIDLGGINGIDLKDWRISDDTLYHIAIANSMLEYKGKLDYDFFIITKNNLVRMHNRMTEEEKTGGIFRYPGKTLNKYIQKFTNDKDGRNLPYDPKTGGNGAAMRNICIGMALYKEEQTDELIKVSIELSKLTHNSPIGFLAGFTSALFASLAVREVNIHKWPFILISLLESKKIKQYIDSDNLDIQMDYITYVRYWKKYLDTRFVDDKPIKTRSTSNMIFRIKYYYENFVKGTNSDYIGGSGFCSLIMTYDALIDCDGLWEKLVFYSILHPGDSDTIGAMAGGYYGLLYGFGDVPKKMLCCIEEKEILLDLGKSFYHKFYK